MTKLVDELKESLGVTKDAQLARALHVPVGTISNIQLYRAGGTLTTTLIIINELLKVLPNWKSKPILETIPALLEEYNRNAANKE